MKELNKQRLFPCTENDADRTPDTDRTRSPCIKYSVDVPVYVIPYFISRDAETLKEGDATAQARMAEKCH